MIGLESRPGYGGGAGACQVLSVSFPVAAGRAWLAPRSAVGDRWRGPAHPSAFLLATWVGGAEIRHGQTGDVRLCWPPASGSALRDDGRDRQPEPALGLTGQVGPQPA